MNPIKNVAIIGASGSLGTKVVQVLLEAGFAVTALARVDSASTFPVGVNVQKVSYDSSSLAHAFKDQDAVVSTIATAALAEQKRIIDAAVQAGVRRFIPSEFGLDTRNITGRLATLLQGKTQTQAQLRELAACNPQFSWTGIFTGVFFDWGLHVGSFGFHLPTQTAQVYDSGNEPFSGCTLPFIGHAIAAVLKNPEGTANRYLNVASLITTQNAVLAALEEETGSKWTVVRKTTADSFKTAEEKMAKGDMSAFPGYVKVLLYKDRAGHSPSAPQLDNKLLGLQQEDVRDAIKSVL